MIRSRQKLGKYQIEAKLGEGGFASVFRARDTIEGVRVALKIPHPQFVNQSTLDDFRKEVRLVAQLHHPNILPLKNAEFIDGHFVVAFPLGDQSLEQRLRKRISFSLALDYTGQILEAVSFAHEHRIIHCDVKPENIVVGAYGEVLLLDWGLAYLREKDENREAIPQPGMEDLNSISSRPSHPGTPEYMSPEQIAGGHIDHRTDIYSLGAILFEVLTQQQLAWGDTLDEMLQNKTNIAPPTPSMITPDRNIPANLESLCLRCIQRVPEHRIQTTLEVLHELLYWLRMDAKHRPV